jgi:hypothetical protein
VAPPAAFGRYQVRRILGSGGFGAVYLGHDTELERPVAIKVLRGGPGRPQAESDRFLQEARRLARLRHPGIVTVHDVGLHEGQVYVVSDYLDGPDLGRWLRDNRPAWPEAARIVAVVADALAHAHVRRLPQRLEQRLADLLFHHPQRPPRHHRRQLLGVGADAVHQFRLRQHAVDEAHPQCLGRVAQAGGEAQVHRAGHADQAR